MQMSVLETKSGKEIKFKQKKDIKEKASADAETTEVQFEEKLDGRTEKKRKKEEKMEGSVIDVVKKNMEKLKKKKKKKKEEFRSDGTNSTSRNTEEMEGDQTDTVEKKNSKRKRAIDGEDLGKHEKKRSKSNIAGLDKEILDEEIVGISHHSLKKKETRKDLRDASAIKLAERDKNENGDNKLQEKNEDIYEVEPRKKRKRKKEKSGRSKKINVEENVEDVRKGEEKKDGSKTNKNFKKASKSEEKCRRENKRKAKATTTGNNDEVKNTEYRKERKKVQFSDEVEVFSAPGRIQKSKKKCKDESEGLAWGRFTKEEDAILLKAIDDYIQSKQLGDNGRDMIYECKKNKLHGCWKEISACLPQRTHYSVYLRGRMLIHGSGTDWSPEDYENLRQFQAEHGHQWKKFADLHLKNNRLVKDAWRRIKYVEQRNGPWTQDEYQALFDLVNLDLKLKAFTVKPEKHRFLRDNIAWETISEKLKTRAQSVCCNKWYAQLTSPLVRDDLWADTDDYRLILALQSVDSSCIEEVDWDNLLPHRDGEVCLKRWLQMVRYIGEHKERTFIEKVEILAQRYCPEMLEYRSEKDED